MEGREGGMKRVEGGMKGEREKGSEGRKEKEGRRKKREGGVEGETV